MISKLFTRNFSHIIPFKLLKARLCTVMEQSQWRYYIQYNSNGAKSMAILYIIFATFLTVAVLSECQLRNTFFADYILLMHIYRPAVTVEN